jgi:hypothetical protein
VAIAEGYRNGAFEARQRPVMKLLRSTNLSREKRREEKRREEHRELFLAAGSADVQIFEEHAKRCICAMGTNVPAQR